MRNAKKIYSMLDHRLRKKLILLAIPVLLAAVLNVFGIFSIFPLLSIVTDPSYIHNNEFSSAIYNMVGFSSERGFMLFVAVFSFASVVLANLLTVYVLWKSSDLVYASLSSLTYNLYSHYLGKPYEFYLKNNISRLTNNLVVLIPGIVQRFILPALEMLSSLVMTIIIVSLLIIVNPRVAVSLALLFGIVYAGVFLLVKKRVSLNSQDIVYSNNLIIKKIGESFAGIKSVKLRSNEFFFRGIINSMLIKRSKKLTSNYTVSVIPKPIIELIAFGGVVFTILVMVLSGTETTEIVPLIAMYAFAGYRMLPSLQKIFFAISSMRSVSADINQIYTNLSLHENEEEMRFSDGKIDQPVVKFERSLEFIDMFYKYPGGTKAVIEGVNLKVIKGEMVGFIGKTGSGKTTLVDILLGLLKPSSGSFLIDEEEMDNPEKISAWQKNLAYVPQNIFLADCSIRENIAFGIPIENIDDTKVNEVAKIAALSELLGERFPQGYHTVVGERGVRLSGGQIQRIGIARALYSEPKVLILDEATSALDSVTECEIMKEIDAMRREMTIIIVAHRLTTVRSCDKLYRLNKGGVIEDLAEKIND